MIGFLVEGLAIYARLSLKGVDETARYSFIKIRNELKLKKISKNLVSKISFLLIVESEC